MENFVSKETGKSLVDDVLIEKLYNIEPGAEANVVKSVNDELNVDDEGLLSIVSVAGSKIANLASNSEFSALINQVNTNVTDISDLVATVDAIDSNLTLLRVDLGNALGTIDAHEQSIETILNILTWQELGTFAN